MNRPTFPFSISVFLVLVTAFLLSACTLLEILPSGKKHQTNYLFPVLDRLYLGMPLAEFQKVKKHPENLSGQPDPEANFRIVWNEALEKDLEKSVTYYFGVEGDKPLYEFIINYKPGTNVAKLAREKYGAPNYLETEWLFRGEEGFDIHIWVDIHKLIIVGKIEGTEWE